MNLKFKACVGISALALLACSEVSYRERYEIAEGRFELTVTSVGGALGEEHYELRSLNEGSDQVFFRGANFSEFRVTKQGPKLMLQLCRGFIDRAEPMVVGQGEALKLVRLDIDWNCKDRARES